MEKAQQSGSDAAVLVRGVVKGFGEGEARTVA